MEYPIVFLPFANNEPSRITNEIAIYHDDNYDLGASTLGEDEDDHDPASFPIFDLAMVKSVDPTSIPADNIINDYNVLSQVILIS